MKEINKRNYFLLNDYKGFHLMLNKSSISCKKLSNIVKDIHQISFIFKFYFLILILNAELMD
jgi:hypothetical protein